MISLNMIEHDVKIEATTKIIISINKKILNFLRYALL